MFSLNRLDVLFISTPQPKKTTSVGWRAADLGTDINGPLRTKTTPNPHLSSQISHNLNS